MLKFYFSEALTMKDSNCVEQKLVRSEQLVNFEAKVKVRTHVRLIEVELDGDCVCINTPAAHTESIRRESLGRYEKTLSNSSQIANPGNTAAITPKSQKRVSQEPKPTKPEPAAKPF